MFPDGFHDFGIIHKMGGFYQNGIAFLQVFQKLRLHFFQGMKVKYFAPVVGVAGASGSFSGKRT